MSKMMSKLAYLRRSLPAAAAGGQRGQPAGAAAVRQQRWMATRPPPRPQQVGGGTRPRVRATTRAGMAGSARRRSALCHDQCWHHRAMDPALRRRRGPLPGAKAAPASPLGTTPGLRRRLAPEAIPPLRRQRWSDRALDRASDRYLSAPGGPGPSPGGQSAVRRPPYRVLFPNRPGRPDWRAGRCEAV